MGGLHTNKDIAFLHPSCVINWAANMINRNQTLAKNKTVTW